MLRVYVIIAVFFGMGLRAASGTTYYTRASGNINGNIWGTTTTGTGGALPTLVDGDILVIDDNVEITTNFTAWNSVTIRIDLYANINFDGGKLDLAENSIIDFKTSSATITSVGGGSSDKIRFGTGSVWDGSDPDIFGPGIMDKNYTAGGPLPVELLFFKATQNGNKIELSWSTASEKNFHYFSIERSTSGTDFVEIGQVKGNGTTNTKHNYSFDDELPRIGKNYYRLKSVDYDGYTEYFNVVMAEYLGEKIFTIYPNPSDGTTINYAMNFSPDENTTMVVYNSVGMKVGGSVPDESYTFTFANPLIKGVYYVKFVSNNFTKIERFVVR